MGTTYGELNTRISTILQDPSRRTFTELMVRELVLSALVEVGRICPEQFTEDLTPVDYQLAYQLRSDTFGVVEYSVTCEADTDLFTSTGHGLAPGDAIRFTGLTGGTGISTGVTYWVIDDAGLDADNFRVSTSIGGTTINVTVDLTAGSWYHLGSGVAVPEIEVARVEVWDASTTPETFITRVQPAATEQRAGDAGWSLWGGSLTLPTRVVNGLVGMDDYVIRVWGYSPYNPPDRDDDVIAVSKEVEQAIVWHCRMEALDYLLASRDLFTQWQTRSGNTDISPAGLMNQRTIAEQMWSRKARQISRLRSEV